MRLPALADLPVGRLVNFNVSMLRSGLRRLTREHPKTFRPFDLPVELLDQESPCNGRKFLGVRYELLRGRESLAANRARLRSVS